jgi:DNA mismatch repair protein MutH
MRIKMSSPIIPRKRPLVAPPNVSQSSVNQRKPINEIFTKCLSIVDIEYELPVTTNKGKPGQFLEDLLGIPHSSECLDCLDGEIKTFPLKMKKDGTFVPKETIAVTMLNKDDLSLNDFKSSKCYKKLSKVLLVPYYRTKDTIKFLTPKLIDKDSNDSIEIYNILESDYNEIRKKYIETGEFSSSSGVLLQNRTKGAGHGSTSRAFYLRQEFIKRCMTFNS